MQDEKKGSIITASLAMAGKFACDEIWQITISDQVIKGARWVPNLAPSVTLFNKYRYLWKGRPEEDWWPQYEEAFKEEMTSRIKINLLRELWNLVDQGKVIALICFCPDDKYCHRRLVAEILAKSGIKTKEYHPPVVEKIEVIDQPSLF
ncbi:MAG TPA: DUF488 family protein [Syntrophomonadaceae bacterium]|nr:DUF488 family protein [Syntrophomonadaceae bacterium]HNX28019.1 DUF488 family protein [Syntrophomonadaceae bacterium]HPR93331.1 DUF488 family protein [Syntrophomonadaceae bacterium]